MNRLWTILVPILILLPTMAQADSCLRLTRTLNGNFGDIWQPFYDSMAASGFCIKILDVPAKRAVAMLHSGESDGEFLQTADRMPALGDTAMLVPEPIHHGVGLFIVRTGSGILPDPKKDIHLGHLVGEGWSSAFAASWPHNKEVPEYASGLKMVRAGRLDAFLIDDFRWRQHTGLQKGLTAIEIGRGSIHMVLHKRFLPQLDRINAAIRTAKGGRASYLDYYLDFHPTQ